MAIHPELLAAIQAKGEIAQRTAYRRIAAKAQEEVWSSELAAAAVALDVDVPVRVVSRFVSPEELAQIRSSRSASQTPVPAKAVSSNSNSTGAGSTRKPMNATKRATRPKGRSTKRVLVVHGRDEPLRRSVFAFLRAVGLTPREWSTIMKDAEEGSPFVGQVIADEIEKAGAIVILLTPDDEARLRKPYRRSSDGAHEATLTGQSRPNVLFEAGIAFGIHPSHTLIVQVGPHRPISDIAGRHLLHLDDSTERRLEFVTRLKGLGLSVDDSGLDWHDTGDFILTHPVEG